MRNESRRVWSLQVEEGGTVQEVLRRQAGFTKKEISRAKFLPDGIRKNGIRCRVTEKTLPGDIIEILLETEQGMLMIRGNELHVNRLTLDKGEVDIDGRIDSLVYSDTAASGEKQESFLGRLFR